MHSFKICAYYEFWCVIWSRIQFQSLSTSHLCHSYEKSITRHTNDFRPNLLKAMTYLCHSYDIDMIDSVQSQFISDIRHYPLECTGIRIPVWAVSHSAIECVLLNKMMCIAWNGFLYSVLLNWCSLEWPRCNKWVNVKCDSKQAVRIFGTRSECSQTISWETQFYNKSAQIISITIPKGGHQKILRVQSREFLQLGLKIMRHHDHMNNKASSAELLKFHAMFGTSPDICSLLWDLLDPTTTMPNEVKTVHLLWD